MMPEATEVAYTYIVTGRHRSGTSMMMRCLHIASSIPVEYDVIQDSKMLAFHADPDYHPNPNGYYQPRHGIRAHDVPGRLIKVSPRNPADFLMLNEGNYKVIQMLRDEDQRRESYKRAFGDYETDVDYELYAKGELLISQRTDFEITQIYYTDMVLQPFLQFQRIAEAGWPIDPAVAARFVDIDLYRNRGELS
jgi:hypothetical protein